MARPLKFKFSNQEYSLEPLKLERKKLYGWSETSVKDKNDKECSTAYLDSTGTILIPKGGTGNGILNSDNQWVEKNEVISC